MTAFIITSLIFTAIAFAIAQEDRDIPIATVFLIVGIVFFIFAVKAVK